MITKTTVSRRILNYLAETNSTNKQLAERLEISPALITYWINEERTPSLKMINRLEAAIGPLEGEFYSNAPYWLCIDNETEEVELIAVKNRRRSFTVLIEYPNEEAMLKTAAYDYLRALDYIFHGEKNNLNIPCHNLSSFSAINQAFYLKYFTYRINYLTEGKSPEIPFTEEDLKIYDCKPENDRRIQRPGLKWKEEY